MCLELVKRSFYFNPPLFHLTSSFSLSLYLFKYTFCQSIFILHFFSEFLLLLFFICWFLNAYINFKPIRTLCSKLMINEILMNVFVFFFFPHTHTHTHTRFCSLQISFCALTIASGVNMESIRFFVFKFWKIAVVRL